MNKQQIDEIREQAAAFTQPDIGDMVILDLLAYIETLQAENIRATVFFHAVYETLAGTPALIERIVDRTRERLDNGKTTD